MSSRRLSVHVTKQYKAGIVKALGYLTCLCAVCGGVYSGIYGI